MVKPHQAIQTRLHLRSKRATTTTTRVVHLTGRQEIQTVDGLVLHSDNVRLIRAAPVSPTSSRGGRPALASLLVIGGIVAVLKPSRRTLLAGLAGVVLIAAAVLARPEDSRMSLGSRCFVECLTEHPETGKALCEEASGRWVERACVCRLPR